MLTLEVPHGTQNGYSNYSCRCDECKAAGSAYYQARRGPLKRRANNQHGVRSMYNKGCRCELCVEAKLWDHRYYTYGLTRDNYNALLEDQNDVCAICCVAEPTVVDHDHVTNKVRGLLCKECNIGLGFFKDNPQSLAAAIAYLGGD